jgi:hypothetical protein
MNFVTGLRYARHRRSTVPKKENVVRPLSEARKLIGKAAREAPVVGVAGLGGVAGGVTGGGSGAAVGFVVGGPPGAAVGFLVGIVGGLLAGGLGAGYLAKRVQKKLEEE